MRPILRAGSVAAAVVVVSVPLTPAAGAASSDYPTAIRACVHGMLDGAARVSVDSRSALVGNGSCATFAGLEPDVTYIVTASVGGRCSIDGNARHVRTIEGATMMVDFRGYCPTSTYDGSGAGTGTGNPYGNNPYYNNPYDRPPQRTYPNGPPKPPAG